jgi:hypothetical protein
MLIKPGLKYLTISIIFLTCITPLLAISPNFVTNTSVLAQTYPFIASTRDFYELDTGNEKEIIDLPSALTILNINSCPGELAIYIHGVWTTEEEAREQTERVFLSLRNSGYNDIFYLIGFSWDSDTAFSLDDMSTSQRGWTIAKNIANENGPLLAQFIDSFKQECPEDNLRIIAHSLGARVVLSAIQSLYVNDDDISPESRSINSVHLLGPAVNDEQVSLEEQQCRINTPPLQCSGDAIYSQVKHFYNLYNPQDNLLSHEEISWSYWGIDYSIIYRSAYRITEGGDPLGADRILGSINVPFNYQEYNVLSYISNDDDADKDEECDIQINWRTYFPFIPNIYYCTITKPGDNHLGYMGYRSEINPQEVRDSGAIELVARQWENENN